MLVSLPTGDRKSSTYQVALEPVREWEAERAEAMRYEVWEYRSRVKSMEKALVRAEEHLAKTGGDWTSKEAQDVKALAREVSNLHQAPVVAPRLSVDDISVEKLADVLAAQGGRILITSPEGGSTFDLMSGRYSRDRAPNLDLYLKGYSGDDHLVDRIGREAKHVPKPHIGMALTTQPEVLRGLAKREGFRGRGVIARFWCSVPHSRVGFLKPESPAIDDGVRLRRRTVLRALLDVPIPVEPYVLRFADKAEDHWVALHRSVQSRMQPEGELCHMTDWGSRAAGGMGRLCGILHLMEHGENPRPWEIPISAGSALKAWAIMEQYLIPHAIAAYHMMGSDSRAELAQDVLGWIKRHRMTRFSRADLHRDLRRQVERPDDWDPPLGLLADHHYILAEESEPQSGPGHPPTPIYDVNPAVFEEVTHESQG